MVCLFSRRVGDTSHTEEKQDMTKNMHRVHHTECLPCAVKISAFFTFKNYRLNMFLTMFEFHFVKQ